MYRKCGYSLIVVLLLSCLTGNPVQTERLAAPQLSFVDLAVVPDAIRGYREAVHLQWQFSSGSDAALSSFTLLRRVPGDSLFDVFSASRGIPADSSNFFDDLSGYDFPETGFDIMAYRIVAIDTFGRGGDTSEICSVALAPQPIFDEFTGSTGCLLWESWIRGGIFSWCRLWSDSCTASWTSDKMLVFPLTDQPAGYSACMPDSLRLKKVPWHYALYVSSNNASSLLLGELDVTNDGGSQ